MLTAGSSGFPTPERKPTPALASAFQGCSNHFEPLKRHLAVGWSQQKSVGDGLERKTSDSRLHPLQGTLLFEVKVTMINSCGITY
ncbi:MAG: hypothetical protein ACLVIF_09755 [Phocaeicola coprocola]|jgi:hypothetical protein|uniref:hypothetical protein n=1 Tax=Phocaeicola coprocola TaxID=310298 RepID=UPI00399BF7DE